MHVLSQGRPSITSKRAPCNELEHTLKQTTGHTHTHTFTHAARHLCTLLSTCARTHLADSYSNPSIIHGKAGAGVQNQGFRLYLMKTISEESGNLKMMHKEEDSPSAHMFTHKQLEEQLRLSELTVPYVPYCLLSHTHCCQSTFSHTHTIRVPQILRSHTNLPCR